MRVGAGAFERATNTGGTILWWSGEQTQAPLALRVGHRLSEEWRSAHNGALVSRYRRAVKQGAPAQSQCQDQPRRRLYALLRMVGYFIAYWIVFTICLVMLSLFVRGFVLPYVDAGLGFLVACGWMLINRR